MHVTVTFFGPLADITQARNLSLAGVADTHQLMQELYVQFPCLQSAEFIIAVNDNIIKKNTLLEENNTIALMPAFSGG